MADTTTDQVAAALAQIRLRVSYVTASAAVGVGAHANARASAADVPRLLAALEAAQALVAKWTEKAAALDAAADRVPEDQPGRALKLARAVAHEDCARELREAISGELLGGEGSRG